MEKRNNRNQFFLNLFFTVLGIVILFPFLLVLSVSFSNEADVVNYGYRILPMHFDWSAYEYVFENPTDILNAYKVTIIFSVAVMGLGVLLMAMLAFMLSKRNLKGKRAISMYIYFTMLFSGGLVPTYILNTNYLHLDDTIWIYILPMLINPWHVFIMRTFFQGIPNEISESAKIDGANEYTIFFRMILPLSKPVLATIALFLFLASWNDWYTAMLYINNEELMSLQYMLQRIMMDIQLLQEDVRNVALMDKEIPAETVRMAMAVVVAGPALLVFPFFQKYFVKGLTVGSVKG